MSFVIKDILHNKARDLLHLETAPGLGCTEPAAIGLCAAAAGALLENKDFDTIEVTVAPNIYKNAMGVIIPASGGKCGIDLAAAIGAIAGDPNLKLQVFARVNPQGIDRAERLINTGKVSVSIEKDHAGIYIKTVVTSSGHIGEAIIIGRHDHIKSLRLDGKPQDNHPLLSGVSNQDNNIEELEKWLISLSLGDLVDILEQLDSDDLSYIQQGIDMNYELVEYGLAQGPGLSVGKTQNILVSKGLLKKDMALWAGMSAAAGIDSRMGGVMLPAMTLAGSGNQGIAAGIPILAVAEYVNNEDNQAMLKAVTLSYLITCCIKTHVGRLGALCGSGVAGGAGVAAGATYLFGGTVDKIGGAIKNHLENFATVVCDGAKTSCALKVGEAVSSAVKSALLALQGTVVKSRDGFIDKSPENTIYNLGTLSHEGLANMDKTIIDIMLNKCQ